MSTFTVDVHKRAEFLAACDKHIGKTIQIQRVLMDAVDHGINLNKYSVANGSVYHNCTQYGDADENYGISESKSTLELARIIQWARKRGYTVEKKYDDDSFNVDITCPGSIDGDGDTKLNFYVNRQVVCTRKVVGTQTITKDIVEWECEKLAFTAMSTDFDNA